ncbi:hypothetical protein SASPL_108191 [Salvia splendens]|uniref:Peroxisomal membrane protein 11C n=1 Tax=Salvia splendens TaxID=180675 RepID=A0A8X8YEA0_SALSN|nr:hypothetical protein SASPL_108191 [Salvia splendens]
MSFGEATGFLGIGVVVVVVSHRTRRPFPNLGFGWLVSKSPPWILFALLFRMHPLRFLYLIMFQFINDLHGLISPPAPGTPLPLVLLGKSKNALLSTFLFLDQIVWLGRTGVYKNKERTELIGRISLLCWLGSSVCTTLVETGEIGRLSASIKKLEKELKNTDKHKNEQYQSKVQKSNQRSLAIVKTILDIGVAVGLLQLAPKKITPRVTGAIGFVTSLISCYQLLPSPPKTKTS